MDRIFELERYEDELNEYSAYMHGVNVGIELIDSGMVEELDRDELSVWLREQFKSRRGEADD